MRIEEIIKQKEFESEYQKLTINLLYTSGWISGIQQRFFKQYNLTMQQYNVLRILRGQKGSPITMQDVVCRMIDKMSNCSRILDKLVTKNWATREPGADDRRKVMVQITQKGLDLLDEIDTHVTELHKLYSGLTEKEAKTLNNLLDKMRADETEIEKKEK
ncbi:MAG: MarR family transcriptional regulator [Bacteroidota bacterium]